MRSRRDHGWNTDGRVSGQTRSTVISDLSLIYSKYSQSIGSRSLQAGRLRRSRRKRPQVGDQHVPFDAGIAIIIDKILGLGYQPHPDSWRTATDGGWRYRWNQDS